MAVVARPWESRFGALERDYLDVFVRERTERIDVMFVEGGKPAIQNRGVPRQVIR